MAIGERTRVIVCTTQGDITLSTFFAQVRGLAAQLPAGRHAINLCEDRYRFLLALCAAAVRGQVT
ncbi:MAG: AMP-ligase, partial [Luteimonas sp.]